MGRRAATGSAYALPTLCSLWLKQASAQKQAEHRTEDFSGASQPWMFTGCVFFPTCAWRGGLPKRPMCFSRSSGCFCLSTSHFLKRPVVVFQAPGCFSKRGCVLSKHSLFCGISLGPPSLGPPKFRSFCLPTLISLSRFFYTFLVSLVDFEGSLDIL